jgi:hypothetical protein
MSGVDLTGMDAIGVDAVQAVLTEYVRTASEEKDVGERQ